MLGFGVLGVALPVEDGGRKPLKAGVGRVGSAFSGRTPDKLKCRGETAVGVDAGAELEAALETEVEGELGAGVESVGIT